MKFSIYIIRSRQDTQGLYLIIHSPFKKKKYPELYLNIHLILRSKHSLFRFIITTIITT
jgi:hypothetical protein